VLSWQLPERCTGRLEAERALMDRLVRQKFPTGTQTDSRNRVVVSLP
jgi:hypothetical protein